MTARPVALALLCLLTAPAVAQETNRSTVGEAGHIVSQPGRDVGIAKSRVPPVLERAAAAPYGSAGTATCAQIRASVSSLDDAIGPDYGKKTTPHGSKTGEVAKIGGQAVVNSVIPFRGVVREVSGAAAADRRLAAAAQAGFARRGYLHGLYTARRCTPAL